MNNKIYQYVVIQESKPIETIKKRIEYYTNNLQKSENFKIYLKNLSEILEFIESKNADQNFLYKPYNPTELDNGTGEAILILQSMQNPKVNMDEVKTNIIKQILTNSETNFTEDMYIEKTALPFLYFLYKKGNTTNNELGTIVNDLFIGFLKLENL